MTLAGRRVEPLENTVTEAGPDGSRTLVVPTDVGRPDAVKAKALFAATRERFGRNCSELRGSEQPAAFQEGIETSGPPGAKEGCQGHLAVGALP